LYWKASRLSNTAITDFNLNQALTVPLLCKEGMKGWLYSDTSFDIELYSYTEKMRISESPSQPPLPLLAKEGSSEDRGCLHSLHLKPSSLSVIVIKDFQEDQTAKAPLLRKEGIKGWLNNDNFPIPRCQVWVKVRAGGRSRGRFLFSTFEVRHESQHDFKGAVGSDLVSA
jgi:hypothetical protein